MALLCVFPPPDITQILDMTYVSKHNPRNVDLISTQISVGENVTDIEEEVSNIQLDVMKEESAEVTADDEIEHEPSYLKIEMELGSGHVFHFTIDLTDTQLDSVASKFCTDHAKEIGVDVVNIVSGCVEPVQRYLTEQVNAEQSKTEPATESTIISVDLDVQGSTVHFEVDAANPNSVKEQAVTFCTQYGAQFGVTEETLPQCIDNIHQALERPIASYKTQLAEEEEDARPAELQQQQQQQKDEAPSVTTESKFINQVFVSSFPLGSKNFEYKYDLGAGAVINAVSFCQSFWDELEGAFVEAGMTGIDEKTCALIVEEVTFPQVQHFLDTLESEAA